jgi:hypothetical protein
MSDGFREELPAGWFMKPVILLAKPEVAAPDIFSEGY